MKELGGSPIEDKAYELIVRQGLRALLGDERAQKSMVGLQNNSAAACEQVMKEAQARYDALTPEQKADPKKTLEQVKVRELAGKMIDDNSYELLVLEGLRALLGDRETQRGMVDLRNSNAAAYVQVKAEAQARYDALSPEQKEDPRRTLEQVKMSVVKLKFQIVREKSPKLKFTSIPRVLKNFLLRQ